MPKIDAISKKKKKKRKAELHGIERERERKGKEIRDRVEGRRSEGGGEWKRAQERKHCTLSANKPGFVVISFCRARVQPAQHTEENTERDPVFRQRESTQLRASCHGAYNTPSHSRIAVYKHDGGCMYVYMHTYVHTRIRVEWERRSDNRESGNGYLLRVVWLALLRPR